MRTASGSRSGTTSARCRLTISSISASLIWFSLSSQPVVLPVIGGGTAEGEQRTLKRRPRLCHEIGVPGDIDRAVFLRHQAAQRLLQQQLVVGERELAPVREVLAQPHPGERPDRSG